MGAHGVFKEVLSECGVVNNGKVDVDKFEDVPFLIKDIIRTEFNVDEVSGKIQSVMGQRCVVSHRFVEDIPPTKSGKYLFTVCKLPTNGYSSERRF